jgi:hypothetical protein
VDVEQALEDHVAARAETWFPELGRAPGVSLRSLSVRPRCSLYVVRLEDGTAVRSVVAKVRRAEADGGPAPQRPSRPRLRTSAATVHELTALEYEGLTTIVSVVGPEHPSFGSVRPLAHLPAQSALVMEHVALPTLRAGFVAERRTATGRSRRRDVPPTVAWHNAGAWLRTFHDSAPTRGRPLRQPTRSSVVERFHAYGEFLSARVGGRSVGDLAAVGAECAGDLLPETLPLVVGHGDYVPRNMFVDRSGRITVFDPMPRWQVPRYEDLCRFIVGLRLSGLQVHSHGGAYSQSELRRREDLFLGGYFGVDAVPSAAVRTYQLLIVLDKWSALLDSADSRTGWRTSASRVMMGTANAFITREARRLVTLLSHG